MCTVCAFFFQAEDGIRDLVRSRGLGDVYKRQGKDDPVAHKRALLLVKNLCKASQLQEATLIQLSDDSMFAGRKNGAYREKDKSDSGDPRAARVLKAERHVLKRVTRHIVLRSGPLLAPAGDNLFSMVMQRLERGEQLECSEDKICPTPANDVARVVVAIIVQLDCGATPWGCLLYTSPSPRDRTRSRLPSSA